VTQLPCTEFQKHFCYTLNAEISEAFMKMGKKPERMIR